MVDKPAADGSAPAVAELVARWVTALRAPASVTMGSTDLAVVLAGLALDLVEAFAAGQVDDGPAERAGAALVRARIPAEDGVACSLSVLTELPAILEYAGQTGSGQVRRLTSAFIRGSVVALRERILSEQEEIQRAAWRALVEARHGWRDSQDRLQAVFEAAPVAIAICDVDGRIIEGNAGLARMIAKPPASLAGLSVWDLVHSDDLPATGREIDRLLTGAQERVRVEVRFQTRGDSTGWVLLSASAISGPDGRPDRLVVVGEDVTDRHRLERTLLHQAYHDALTGLPNRLLLEQRLAETLRRAAPHDTVGVFFIDLDDFKAVNDTLGHRVGDGLLVAVAGRLRAACGPDRLVARIGGDEFVIVIPDSAGPAALGELADRILAALAAPFHVDGYRVGTSASIGIVEQPAATADPERLLRAADATLYLSKADGRGRWTVFDAHRNAQQLRRYELLARLPDAIARGEFALLYQPLVSLRDNTIVGVEALVRWHHPQLGTLAPGDFIPAAEHTGLIVALGRWVIGEACTQAASWREHLPHPLFVSVNVSPRQCSEPGLVGDVTDALRQADLPASQLQVELTETAVMQPADGSIATLRSIADLGVRVAIDDFGIGYSNLAHLRHLPVHGLKLAGAFMEGVRSPATDHVDEQILHTIIKLAHTLKLTVTAEGIETADQARRLTALDCDIGQGWHYGTPTTPDRIPDMPTTAGNPAHAGRLHNRPTKRLP